MRSHRDVVVTGIGLVTALGIGHERSWTAMIAGDCGVGPLTGFDTSTLRTRWGAEIADFDPTRFASRRTLRSTTREDQLAMAGVSLAVADAGVDPSSVDPERVGLFLGGNKEISAPHHLLEGALAVRDEQGRATEAALGRSMDSSFYPLFYVEGLQAAALFYASQQHGIKGVNGYFHGTAEAGLTAIGRAVDAVRSGECEQAVAGGADSPVGFWPMSRMDGLGVLSQGTDAGDFRPYDVARSGSLLGEGSAMLLVESAESARRRGARTYCRVAGFGSAFDVGGLIAPDPSGKPLTMAAVAAGRQAGWGRLGTASLDQISVDYIATHGCATALGDASEARGLRSALGESADHTVASSVKPAIGHLVGAAGAANAVVTALALHHGEVPPTLNLSDVDPTCDLDWVPQQSRRLDVRTALAIARGLEGQNVALAMEAA